MRLLLEYKADVDAKTVGGKTVLYLTAENRHEAVVQMLLKHMADVYVKDNDGRTARCIRQLRMGTRQRCGCC